MTDFLIGKPRFSNGVFQNLRTVEQANLIFYIEKGRMLEHGTELELMALGGRYAQMHTLKIVVVNCTRGEEFYALKT